MKKPETTAKNTKNVIALLLAGSVLGLGSAAAQNTAYGDFDANSDGGVDAAEFNDGFGSGLFDTFNADGNDVVDQNEFSGGVYNLFDANSDGALSEDEYNTGVDTLYDGNYDGAYGDFDADGDGTVTQEEFANTYDSSGLYGDFDADGNDQVDQTEFNEGLFGVTDTNDDGLFTEDEYNDAPLLFTSVEGNVAGSGVARSRSESFNPDDYGGVFGEAVVSEYEPYEADNGGGAVSLAYSTPNEQNVDFNVTGPNGYREDFEVGYFGFETGGDARILEGLPPGVYSVAATDDNLQLIETKVEVREGELIALNFNMQLIEDANYDLADYQPYGNAEVGAYEPVDTVDYGTLEVVVAVSNPDDVEVVIPDLNVTGPDDFRREFEGAENVLGSLLQGPYSVAATAEGYGMTEGKVDIRNGQALRIILTLEPLN